MDTGKSTRKGNEGYYTLEAAIFLPIFIVAVLTIGFFMKLIGAEEKIMHSGTDEARYLAVEAYEIKTSLGFSGTLERRILKENEELDQVQVSNLQFLYAKGGIDGLISFDVEGEMEIPLPIGLYQGFTLKEKIVCRAWIGLENTGSPMAFSDMEKEEEATEVWVFPRSGTHYHGQGCTYVSNVPRELLLSDKLAKKYAPCKTCDAQELASGSLIYCFPKYGEVYHRGDCAAVKKYVVPMEQEEAEGKGYAPCGKCGGKS